MTEPTAYDNAVYRWNHRESEDPDATFSSIWSEEIDKKYDEGDIASAY